MKSRGIYFEVSYSYFENGIRDVNPKKNIDFPQLIKIIKNNPNRSLIEQIRTLRLNGDYYYKTLKDNLPNITPNCVVGYRSLKGNNIDTNLKMYSQYMYFDIDEPGNEYKQYIIQKYGHLVSMVCTSSSAGGVSLLFKITNQITKDNFNSIWTYIRYHILGDETVDEKCKDIARAWFISYDPDVYVNYDNEISINEHEIEEEERVNHPISNKHSTNRVKFSFSEEKEIKEKKHSIIPIDIVLSKLSRRTNVIVDNPIVDFKPVEYAELYIPKIIKDGTKHTTYTSMIHLLIHLNPYIEREYIFSFLYYVNNVFAKPRMELKELSRLFNFLYSQIKSSGEKYTGLETKMVHFSPRFKLTGSEKNKVANILNGYFKRYRTINKIIEAKLLLSQQGEKINQKKVSTLSGMSLKTVQKYFNCEPIDFDIVIEEFNDPSILFEKYLFTEDCPVQFKDKITTEKHNTRYSDYIHPDCPIWVVNYINTGRFVL